MSSEVTWGASVGAVVGVDVPESSPYYAVTLEMQKDQTN